MSNMGSESDTETPDDEVIKTDSAKKFSVKDEFILDAVTGKYKCRHCTISLTKDKTGSTGNLSKHLQRAHKHKFGPITDNDGLQQTFLDAFRGEKVFGQSVLEKKILNFVIMTSQPFRIVDSVDFKNLFPTGAKIPCANTIQSKIHSMYEEEKEKIKLKLKETPGKISLILDCWKTKNRISYHGIIAAWISQDWNYEEVLLDLDILKGSHTGVNLAQSLSNVLRDFGIPFEKILAITTDNASNCDTMFVELAKIMQSEGVTFVQDDQRVRCLAHVVNLACQASLNILKTSGAESNDAGDESDDNDSDNDSWDDDDDGNDDAADQIFDPAKGNSVYSRVRNSICKIRLSEDLSTKFQEACSIYGHKKQKLILDVKTRWNSTYLMLKRILELREPYESLVKKEKSLYKFELSGEEWTDITEITAFLQPFFDVTQLISKAKLPSMSFSAAIYIKLYNHLEKYSLKTHGKFLVDAAKAACQKFNKYYPSTDGLVYVGGLVLDPRCKFEWYSQVGISSVVVKKNKIALMRLWDSLYKPTEAASSSEVEDCGDILAAQMKRAKLSRDDFRKYISIPVEDASKTDDILRWWKDNELAYPDLAKMARDYLAVSGSGVPIERVFSYGTELLRVKRRIMKPQTTRALFCLRAWLKFQGSDYRSAKMMATAKKCYA